MPPAFVLSQDQTLRKTIICLIEDSIQSILFKTLFRLIEILRFTSHYSIFNQLINHVGWWRVLNISSIFYFSSGFLKNFWFFSKPPDFQSPLLSNPVQSLAHGFLICHSFSFLQAVFWIFFWFFHIQPKICSISINPIMPLISTTGV